MIFKVFEIPTLHGGFTKFQGLQKHCYKTNSLIEWNINNEQNRFFDEKEVLKIYIH